MLPPIFQYLHKDVTQSSRFREYYFSRKQEMAQVLDLDLNIQGIWLIKCSGLFLTFT